MASALIYGMEVARKKPRRIVWAVDAFDDPKHLREIAPPALRSWVEQFGADAHITPVYVLSPGEINLSLEFSGPMIEQYRAAAEKALAQALQGITIPQLMEPEVIAENFTSTAQAAKTLASHAYAMNTDLIVVASHGRRGIGRFFMGSFAENLIYYSKVPVLILRPQMKPHREIKNILVPTSFGFRSKAMFKKIVDQARDLSARLVLFHTIPHPMEPLLQSGAYLAGGSWIPVQAYFSVETDRHRRRAEAWARYAEHQGVPCEVIVDAQGSDIAYSINYLAQTREVDLIAMESRTGPMMTSFLGSITRHVIRHAECPVWVYRPTLVAAFQRTLPRAA